MLTEQSSGWTNAWKDSSSVYYAKGKKILQELNFPVFGSCVEERMFFSVEAREIQFGMLRDCRRARPQRPPLVLHDGTSWLLPAYIIVY